MNEELKILIRTVTSEAKKNLTEVRKELENIDKKGSTAGKSLDKSMKSVAKSAAVAVGSIAAVTAALISLGKEAQNVQKGFEKLNTAFVKNGSTTSQAADTYKQLFGFLGDHDKAIETAQSLALITNEEQKLAEWSQVLKGAWAEMGDKLPIEGLAEAANETINVGKVTGVMADALNWAGVSEDAFNAVLEQTTSLAEREALVRNTLNGLYGNSAKLYDAAYKSTLNYNTAQANLNITMGRLSGYLTPLLTSIVTLGNVMLTSLAPAIKVVSIYMTAFIQIIAEAIQWVGSFFGLFQSKTETVAADMEGYQAAMNNYTNSLRSYFGSTESGIDGSLKKVKELKKQVMGFDELNVVSNPATADISGGAASIPAVGGADIPAAPNPADYGIGTSGLDMEQLHADIEDAKKLIKELIVLIGIVTAAIALWKLGGFLTDLWEAHKILKNLKGLDIEDLSLAGKLSPDEFWAAGFKEKLLAPFTALKGVIANVGGLVGGGFGAGLAVIAGVLALIGSAVYFLYQNWDAVVAAVKNFFAENIAPKLQVIKEAFAEMGGTLKNLWDSIAPAIELIGGVVVAILGGVVAGAINGFVQLLVGAVEMLQGLFDFIGGIIGLIVGLFTGDLQKAGEAWRQMWDGAGRFFKGFYDATIGVVVEFVKGIIDWFVKLWDELVGHSIVPDMVEAIIKWFKELPGKLFSLMADFVKKIIAYFADLAKQAGAKASEMWVKVKAPFSNVAAWFKNIFQQAWNGIKSIWNGVGTFFTGVWNNIKSIFSKVGTSIAQGVTGAVKGAINSVLTTVTNKINTFIGWINGAVDLINKIPGVNIGTITKLSVPKLATGGITTGATMAMIGERGREAVLPLENNTGWMDTLAERIAARTPQGPTKIVLQVGEKELGWASIKSINNITKQTGGLQLHLV